jgi:hypothetical protein
LAQKTSREKAKTSALVIKLDEKDFEEPVALAAAHLELAQMSLDERVEHIRKLLPGIVAKIMLGAVPSGFALKQLTLSIELSGKPWGVGVAGTAGVVFEKN